MSKHSLGPWSIAGDRIIAADGITVCEIEESRDARLIAAAPRMRLLLAEGSAPNDNPWSHELWRRRVEALLAEIDGEPHPKGTR